MSQERDNLLEIFDVITNNHNWWMSISFTKKIVKGKEIFTIKAKDQYGNKYYWSEEF